MPQVKTLRNRGATIVVEANGELLFTPLGPITQWNRRISRHIREAAIAEAPSNKRPRWSHYGKPLKATMRATTRSDPVTMHAYAAVGSTAPYSLYVDQGTGIYAGRAPYQGKILPPWFPGSPSLYEHTWRPLEGKEYAPRIGTVTIKGQKGQHFFDKALKRGLAAEAIATTTGLYPALDTFPDSLTGFLGPFSTPAFIGQLNEWRQWRDAAWSRDRPLGEGKAKARGTAIIKARQAAREARRAALRTNTRQSKDTRVRAELAKIRQERESAKREQARQQVEALERARKQRARQEAERVRKMQEAKDQGRRKREKREAEQRRQEAQRASVRALKKAESDAWAYQRRIKVQYPDATVHYLRKNGVIKGYSVDFRGPDGPVEIRFLP
jgi:hypothetical protein